MLRYRLPADAIIGCTPGTTGASGLLADAADEEQYTSRAAEIRAWLAAHPHVTRYVVLDDRPSAADEVLAPNFVRTRAECGLSEADAARCRTLLAAADQTI